MPPGSGVSDKLSCVAAAVEAAQRQHGGRHARRFCGALLGEGLVDVLGRRHVVGVSARRHLVGRLDEDVRRGLKVLREALKVVASGADATLKARYR